MEGVPTNTRKPRSSSHQPSKKAKLDKVEVKKPAPEIASERTDAAGSNAGPKVKPESVDDSMAGLVQPRIGPDSGPTIGQFGALSVGSRDVQMLDRDSERPQRRDFGQSGVFYPPLGAVLEKPREVVVKIEPTVDD